MKHFHPRKIWRITKESLYNFFWYYLLPDSIYLRIQYKRVFHKSLNLKNPTTFNEKIQWLKLYDRNPLYHNLVDKVKAKEWVKDKIGEKYIIPTLGIWNSVDEIDWKQLPNQFVIKCNHDAASYCICTDKQNFDIEAAKRKLDYCLKVDYYHHMNKQWVYKDISRKIIAEKFMKDSKEINFGLTDYKFFCFNGVVDCVMIALDRETKAPKFYFFDRNWNLLRLNYRGLEAPKGFSIPKPCNVEEMFCVAEKLCEKFPFVRVDLYNCDGQIYFGEMTFNPDGGMDNNILPLADKYFGSKLILKNENHWIPN